MQLEKLAAFCVLSERERERGARASVFSIFVLCVLYLLDAFIYSEAEGLKLCFCRRCFLLFSKVAVFWELSLDGFPLICLLVLGVVCWSAFAGLVALELLVACIENSVDRRCASSPMHSVFGGGAWCHESEKLDFKAFTFLTRL